jgi:ABC-type branched-subunit amino acid transport system permease subunit
MPFESISSALDRSGFLPGQYKLASFVLAGAIAGIAGYLNAAQFSFVSPADLS